MAKKKKIKKTKPEKTKYGKKRKDEEKVKLKLLKNIKVRRLLALLKAKVEFPDRKFNLKLPVGFRESFESQDNFRGWLNYHVTWDVTREDPWTIYLRKKSLIAEWHEELARVVPVINADGIHEA